MPDKFFLSAAGADVLASLPGERVLWSGRCAVAEYAFEEPASLPRWTMPEETEVFVTETRVVYADPAGLVGGQLRWPWPQHLRVQPGNRDTGRSATVTQIQLVCGGAEGTFPALVFAGGELTTVADADRLANVLRQAISRYRVEHVDELGLSMPQSRMLSRLVIGPEFSNYQGGEGQTVSLLGSQPVTRPATADGSATEGQPVPARPSWGDSWEGAPAQSSTDEPFLDDYFAAGAPPAGYTPYPSGSYTSASYGGDPYAEPAAPAAMSVPAASFAAPAAAGWPVEERPHLDADEARARQAQRAEQAARHAQPDLASRAADLAARVASLVSGGAGLDQPVTRFETETTNLSAFLNPPAQPRSYPAPDSIDAAERAETIRRTAARFAGNSARARTSPPRRADEELGATSRGHRKA